MKTQKLSQAENRPMDTSAYDPETEWECMANRKKLDMKPQHTPTPWKLLNRKSFGGQAIGTFGNEVAIVYGTSGYLSDTNAAFIVKAVNSHEELIKAANDLLDGMTPNTVEALKQAIAKAEKGE